VYTKFARSWTRSRRPLGDGSFQDICQWCRHASSSDDRRCLSPDGANVAIGRDTLDKLVEDVAVSGRNLQTDLGFQPVFDLAAGWREALDPIATQRRPPVRTASKC